MGLAAVYSCVRIIADGVASLPIHVYRKTGGEEGGPARLPYSQLLDNPSADLDTTLYDWVFMALSSCLLWGNAWGLISSRTGVTSPSGLGYPQTIEWLPPDRMYVQDDTEQPWNPMKARIFLDGHEVRRSELVHMRACVVPGRLEAISPLRAFSMLYSQGMEALKYSATWFRNGGFPPGTFQNLAEEVDAEQAREIRSRLTDTLRTQQPLVYGKDWDYKPVVVPPSEAAFVEAMQLNATQVAAIYGVPPTKVGGRRGDSLTYATQEQETLSLITDTLRPWLVRMEHLLTSLLPATQYARFNTDALLKTDLKTRSEIYRMQREMGMITVDEIRQTEDMAPMPGTLGQETMPLQTMSQMAGNTRAIPKSMIDQVVLEPAIFAKLLEELQQKGLTPPPEPGMPGGMPMDEASPAKMLGPVAASKVADTGPTSKLSDISKGGGQGPDGTAPQGAAPPKQNGGFGGGYPIPFTPAGYLGHQVILARDADGEPAQPGLFGLKHHRATAADRQRASTWVDNAAANACLDEHEYEQRIYKVSKARIRGQLDDLVCDLPPEDELVPPQQLSQEVRDGEPALFGPAALALLQGRSFAEEFGTAGEPALNGKAH